MTTYKPGDVVLIPFPFTDLSTVKQRPAVALRHELGAGLVGLGFLGLFHLLILSRESARRLVVVQPMIQTWLDGFGNCSLSENSVTISGIHI